MGILDDAIREHLALKRSQGLGEDELKRLEDEAFGPPSRPGDPDFPDQEDGGEGDAPGLEDESALEADREAEPVEPGVLAEDDSELIEAEAVELPDDEPAGEPATALFDRSPSGDGEPGEEKGMSRSLPPFDADDLDLDFDSEPLSADDAVAARDQPPPLESIDTVEHRVEEHEAPAPERAEEEEAAQGRAVEDEVEAAEPEAVDLGLEEPEAREPETGEPETLAAQTAEVPEHEPPSDEFRFDEPETGSFDEPEAGAHPGEESVEDFDEGEADDGGADGEAEAPVDEDVLEETPEFLRDAPEDDELWFEQGEPKDFDF